MKCGFLDLRLPKRSCKVARFGSGVLPNSLDNVAVQLVSRRALLYSNENRKEEVLPRLFPRPYSALHRPLMHKLFAVQLNRSTIFRVEQTKDKPVVRSSCDLAPQEYLAIRCMLLVLDFPLGLFFKDRFNS